MNTDYTHITIILDSSGSMSSIADDTIGGFNQFLTVQKALPGKLTLTQVHFSSGVHRAILKEYGSHKVDYYAALNNFDDIKAVKSLTSETFVPGGMTPLLDSVGIAIQETGQALKAMKEEERPSKVLFVIITDGQENTSRIFNRAQIKSMIDEQTNKYGWMFSFLGANFDAVQEGATLGISAKNSMSYAASAAGVGNTYNIFSSKVGMMRGLVDVAAASASMDYNDEDRVKSMAEDEKPEDLADRLAKFKQTKSPV